MWNSRKKSSPSPHALIVGATSSLSVALCRLLAGKGYRLTIAARDKEELDRLAGDLLIRHGTQAHVIVTDLSKPSFSAEAFLDETEKHFGIPQELYLLAATMGHQDTPETAANITNVVTTNFLNPAKLLALSAQRMAGPDMRRTIVAVSSVAGDRGRQSNFVYGSSKAGLTSYASGLRNKYSGTRVHVLTVKPGFVDTSLTWGMASPLIASRESVARAILRAVKRRRNVLYAPAIWWFIMTIIVHLPECVFKRLKL